MAGRILVVDDNRSARELIDAILGPEGYDLHFAVDGPQALSMLDAVQPELVLLDVMMPGMDGIEVCRRIRAHPQWRTLPVILVTALQDRRNRLQGLEAGADDFLSKPVDVAELQARVRNSLVLSRMRRQLQERERFEWVVMHSRTGFLWLDGQGRIVGSNPVAAQWLDLERQAPVYQAQPWIEALQTSFKAIPPMTWEEVSSQKAGFECTVVRPESAEWPGLWLHVAGSPLSGAEPGAVEWMISMEDVTEQQKQMQTTVTLISTIAHKLRTPLALVRGPLDLITSGGLTPDDPEWPEFLDMADSNLKRLEENITQILGLVPLWEKPLHHWQYEYVQPEALSRLLDQVRQEFAIADARFRLDLRLDQPVQIQPDLLRQILRQLLDNAVKFHPDHTPTVRVLLEHSQEGRLRLCVEDDGPGIPPEYRERVWYPLYQLDRDQAGQIPGIGLGLTLVANWAWSWGGRTWIGNGALGGAQVCVEFAATDQGRSS